MTPCLKVLSLLVSCCLCACSDAPDAKPPTASYSRIVTLAPNLTELVFEAGAGGVLVGVSAYSDFPLEARDLPLAGDAFAVDQEQLALLQPDLLLAWQSGTPSHVIDELRGVGYRVETIRTRSLDDVASALRQIGKLTGFSESAERAARAYVDNLKSVEQQSAGLEKLRVFYQVSRRPLYTVNGDHYVSELISMCGGSNIFADLNELAPTVDVEAVVERNPQVLLASTDAGLDAFDEWSRWPHMAANQYQNHFLMPADEIGRASPRLVRAARAVCAALQVGRERRDRASSAPE